MWRQAEGFLFLTRCALLKCASLQNKNDIRGCGVSQSLPQFESFPPFHQEFTPLLLFIVNFSDWGLEIAKNSIQKSEEKEESRGVEASVKLVLQSK